MSILNVLSLLTFVVYSFAYSNEDKEPVLYYYGIEESERGLPECETGQACSVVLQRYWRPDALVRLCRCSRRQHCDTRANNDHRIELNNRAYFQFCQPITDWPNCKADETSMILETLYDQINPDELEELHHRNIQLIPPKIKFNCQCRMPNYWRLKSKSINRNGVLEYRCASLPICRTDELCGTVSNDHYALYQSCLCPKHHICVQSGGIPHHLLEEVLYNGIGWRAYCQHIEGNDSYEDY